MFEQIMKQQGAALEALMANQPAANPHLMDEARVELKNAIDKAVSASKGGVGE